MAPSLRLAFLIWKMGTVRPAPSGWARAPRGVQAQRGGCRPSGDAGGLAAWHRTSLADNKQQCVLIAGAGGGDEGPELGTRSPAKTVLAPTHRWGSPGAATPWQVPSEGRP